MEMVKIIRDWLYVSDHCKGIELVFKNGKPGETYNIGGKTRGTIYILRIQFAKFWIKKSLKVFHIKNKSLL